MRRPSTAGQAAVHLQLVNHQTTSDVEFLLAAAAAAAVVVVVVVVVGGGRGGRGGRTLCTHRRTERERERLTADDNGVSRH